MKFAPLRKSSSLGLPISLALYLGFFSGPALAQSSQEPIAWNADAFAHQIVSGLWPDEKLIEAAVVDLDADGIGEILVRFTDRCVAPEIENSPPNCAYGLIRHDGLNWIQIEQAPARDVSLYRSPDGAVLSFDGLGVKLIDGATVAVPDFIYPSAGETPQL